MAETREQQSSFTTLLEAAAMELRNKGSYSVELSSQELEQMMRQVVAQSEPDMKKQGITARIDELGVRISHRDKGGRGEVHTKVHASKKVGFLTPSVDITADFTLENGQKAGLLNTANLSVQPQKLFGLVEPMGFLAPYVEGAKINTTFQGVLSQEMNKRGATIQGMQLGFTERNTLRVDLTGGQK